MRILFMDAETNGYPKFTKTSKSDDLKTGRIIQLAWSLHDIQPQGEGFILKPLYKDSALIKPDGWAIPSMGWWPEHGFNHFHSMEHGVPLYAVFERFVPCILNADTVAAHNIDFDVKVTLAELRRYGHKDAVQHFEKITCICTMKTTRDLVKAKNKLGSLKNPSLAELYWFLHGNPLRNAHDAEIDRAALESCFLKLLAMGHYKIKSDEGKGTGNLS
jgi:hypothetical protein